MCVFRYSSSRGPGRTSHVTARTRSIPNHLEDVVTRDHLKPNCTSTGAQTAWLPAWCRVVLWPSSEEWSRQRAVASRCRLTSAWPSAILNRGSSDDGFIRELRLVSHDWFADRGVQRLTGDFDLEILFAHYNYGQGEPPPDRLVSAQFAQVKELELRVTGFGSRVVSEPPGHHSRKSAEGHRRVRAVSSGRCGPARVDQ